MQRPLSFLRPLVLSIFLLDVGLCPLYLDSLTFTSPSLPLSFEAMAPSCFPRIISCMYHNPVRMIMLRCHKSLLTVTIIVTTMTIDLPPTTYTVLPPIAIPLLPPPQHPLPPPNIAPPTIASTTSSTYSHPHHSHTIITSTTILLLLMKTCYDGGATDSQVSPMEKWLGSPCPMAAGHTSLLDHKKCLS